MLSLIPEAAYRDGIVSRRTGPLRWHVISGPEEFAHVVRDSSGNYPKAAIMHRLLGPYLGEGLVLAEGASWAWQRRTLGTAFRRDELLGMTSKMLEVAVQTADRLLQRGVDGPVAISSEMRHTALDMVQQTIFTGLARAFYEQSNDPRLDRYREGIQPSLDRFLLRVSRPSPFDLVNLPAWVRLQRRRDPLTEPRAILAELISRRRAAGDRPGDLLDLMLHAADPATGRKMNDTELRDNLLTFVIAGSDTTALTLTWAIFALTQAPGIAERVRAEADAAFSAGGDAPQILQRLSYTKHVLEETLRLFPPTPLLIRSARAPDRIGDIEIRRKEMVVAAVFALHRHPAFWPNPLVFDPERFAKPTHPRFAYLPFGAGPRICIASSFAMMEAQLTLATLARRMDFQLAPGWTVTPRMLLTLKPDGGLPVLVRPRVDPGPCPVRSGSEAKRPRLQLPDLTA